MKKLIKLGTIFMALSVGFNAYSAQPVTNGAETCKAEGMAMDISEDFLWVLRDNDDIVTESEYQAVLNMQSKLASRHQQCVKGDTQIIDS